jgi:DNA-binding GntR family transcriptional regulator
MRLPPLGPSHRITDVVFNTLRDAILKGELPAGYQLSVPRIARELGVSRSPVREAVLQLASHGLGHAEPRKGVVVARLDENALIALHEIREVLEGLSARRAASRIDDESVSEIRDLLKKQAAALENKDGNLYVQTDQAFHDRLAEISGDERLCQLLKTLSQHMRLNMSVALSRSGHIDEGHKEHLEIVTALSQRNPHLAEERMRSHIRNARERVAKILSHGRASAPLDKGSAKRKTVELSRQRELRK